MRLVDKRMFIDAPPARVYELLTDAELLVEWMAPIATAVAGPTTWAASPPLPRAATPGPILSQASVSPGRRAALARNGLLDEALQLSATRRSDVVDR
jgi:hypothetical protein